MFKRILLIITMLYAAAAFAAVDVNKASAAELDGIKGIGPSLSTKILEERKNGNYKDWSDFISRVGGVGEKTAAKFSTDGLTVNGKKFSAAAVAKADGKAGKTGAKDKEAKAADKKSTSGKNKKDEKTTSTAPSADASTGVSTAEAAIKK
jgi:competence protein ComEA